MNQFWLAHIVQMGWVDWNHQPGDQCMWKIQYMEPCLGYFGDLDMQTKTCRLQLGRVLLNSHSFWVCQKTTTSRVCFFVGLWVMLQYFFKARKTKVLRVSMSSCCTSDRQVASWVRHLTFTMTSHSMYFTSQFMLNQETHGLLESWNWCCTCFNTPSWVLSTVLLWFAVRMRCCKKRWRRMWLPWTLL